MTRTTLAALLAALLVLPLAGCGASNEDPGHNDADVSFAREMIAHHAQAITMANLTIGRDRLDPKVAKLAEQIRLAQTPEIDRMSRWLRRWHEPVPKTGYATGDGHSHSERGMTGTEGMSEDMQMPGMMSGAEMRRLGRSRGAAFETQWLQMMVEHHRGAVAMARTERARGSDPGALALAEDITRTQRREVSRMRDLLREQ